ncbi:MAG: acyl-CoA dehydrogenase, partial [Actinomycetes bacterium]
FCSGAGLLRRALVVATAPDGPRLFDLDVGDVDVVAGTWPAVGMAGSQSSAVRWAGRLAPAELAVGEPGAYTSRVGFWWGAAGVAACWWGGARALVETTRTGVGSGVGESQLAALGRSWARLAAMEQVLRQAAASIDDATDVDRTGPDAAGAARRTALIAREVVHDGCQAVLREVAAAGGAGPICLDPAQSRRSADLYAYLAQYHPGRDQAELGRMLVAE